MELESINEMIFNKHLMTDWVKSFSTVYMNDDVFIHRQCKAITEAYHVCGARFWSEEARKPWCVCDQPTFYLFKFILNGYWTQNQLHAHKCRAAGTFNFLAIVHLNKYSGMTRVRGPSDDLYAGFTPVFNGKTSRIKH